MKILKSWDKYKILLIVQIVIFVSFCVYLAANVRLGISPDENYHFNVSKAYATTLGIPPNTSTTYQFGDITTGAFLYFWVNGRVLNINIFGLEELLLLRIVSILFSTGTLLTVYLLSKELIKNKLYQIIPVVLLANTLMFTFLSAMVNYDNLANLFAALSILVFVKILKNPKNLNYVFLWIIFASLGALTKFTILPLAFIQFILIAYQLIRNINAIDFNLRKVWGLVLVALVTVVSVLYLYGGNLVKYKDITPGCDKVMTVEQCMNSALFRRDYGRFPDIEVFTYSGIVSTVFNRISPIEYFATWVFAMSQKIYGIMGHEVIYLPSMFYSIYVLIGLVAIVLFIRHWRIKESIDLKLLVLLAFYGFILAIGQNYKSYISTGVMSLALQGRYIFPVISIYYVLLVKYYSLVSHKHLRSLLLILLVLTFLIGCVPFFFLAVNPSWFF